MSRHWCVVYFHREQRSRQYLQDLEEASEGSSEEFRSLRSSSRVSVYHPHLSRVSFLTYSLLFLFLLYFFFRWVCVIQHEFRISTTLLTHRRHIPLFTLTPIYLFLSEHVHLYKLYKLCRQLEKKCHRNHVLGH